MLSINIYRFVSNESEIMFLYKAKSILDCEFPNPRKSVDGERTSFLDIKNLLSKYKPKKQFFPLL